MREHTFDPEEFLASGCEHRTLVSFSKGHTIFRQGEPANAAFYIHKGRVKLTIRSESGREVMIDALASGDFLGENVLQDMSRVDSAIALTDCELMRIDKTSMMRAIYRNQEFSKLLISYLLAKKMRYEQEFSATLRGVVISRD